MSSEPDATIELAPEVPASVGPAPLAPASFGPASPAATSNEPADRPAIALDDPLDVASASALLHAMRASALQIEVARRDVALNTRWRRAQRIPRRLLRGLIWAVGFGWLLVRVTIRKLRENGVADTAARGWARLMGRPRVDPNAPPRLTVVQNQTFAAYRRAPTRSPSELLAPRILIIAELSIPQCTKYRVTQKREHFAGLGLPCTVIDWRRGEEAKSALQVHSAVIFYRVPDSPEVLGAYAEAKRLGVPTSWEVDDLIIDVDAYAENGNLASLSRALQKDLLDGVAKYRRAMLGCAQGIASTEALADAMRAAGLGRAIVVENALDRQTLTAAAAIRAEPRRPRVPPETILIGYGSGTKTHDVDFKQVEAALLAVFAARPHVRLRIFGDLGLGPAFDALADRIDRMPFAAYPVYLRLFAECDIAIAPLEPTRFNDAKSNIKYIEAAILAVPAICSARRTFRDVIEDGANGFLADDTPTWTRHLLALVDDPSLRARIGAAALATVLDRYEPVRLAARQLAPYFADLDHRDRRKRRVLVVNIFYAPRSFGGATIVAESLARHLHARPDTEVAVFTSCADRAIPQYCLCRYEDQGIPVIAVGLPYHDDGILTFDNPEMARVFAGVLSAVEPDVVHFHSIQQLSTSMLRVCQTEGVPYIVTAHDAWWLCERQFMVREDGAYCGQRTIDLAVCQACVPWVAHLRERRAIMMQGLHGATCLLAPSEVHRSLYIANGFAPDRVRVNRNGIRQPAPSFRRKPSDLIRFAYVGGADKPKGYDLVREAFAAIEDPDYELRVVDNKLNLGLRSIDLAGWRLAGRGVVLPAYQQDELDDFFSEIDVLVFPSQWKESFGLTIVEALIRDVWVIATDGIGAAEAIVDGVNGTIIPMVNDPEPLRAAIAACLSDRLRLAAHVNPRKDVILTQDQQAAEIALVLETVLAR